METKKRRQPRVICLAIFLFSFRERFLRSRFWSDCEVLGVASFAGCATRRKIAATDTNGRIQMPDVSQSERLTEQTGNLGYEDERAAPRFISGRYPADGAGENPRVYFRHG